MDYVIVFIVGYCIGLAIESTEQEADTHDQGAAN